VGLPSQGAEVLCRVCVKWLSERVVYSPSPHRWSAYFGMLTSYMTFWALGKATGELGPNSGVFFRPVAFLRPPNVT
jgi:hypothetical protein